LSLLLVCFNTLTISLLERTKDIGIMKALGATDRSVYAIFLAESMIISFAGGIVGIIIAMILGLASNFFLSLLAVRAGGDKVANIPTAVAFCWYHLCVLDSCRSFNRSLSITSCCSARSIGCFALRIEHH